MESIPDASGPCMHDNNPEYNINLWPGEVLASSEQSAAAEAGELPLLDVQDIADK